MTLEEFQAKWQMMESDKQTMSKEDFNKKYSTKKKESKGKYLDGSGPWQVGEWRSMQYNGNILLKYCRAFYDIDAETIVLVKPKDDKKHRYAPMFTRYFIIQKGGNKELWSCYRMKGAEKGDEGVPFKMLYDVTNLDKKQIIALLDEGTFYDWSKTCDKAPKTYIKQKKFGVDTIGDIPLSTEYDGVSILVLMTQRPKGTYNYFLNMILHEGGSIDENNIIHKNPDAPGLIRF